ncbi:MAG TPA: M48 family metalloprotease [Syntrophorhabdales bacterium]|nr:M48 family metalloprotease [Syntrophorhabdales bacterium]
MKFKILTAVILLVCFPLTTFCLTLTEEVKMGKQIHQEVLRAFRLNNDPYVCLYMGRVAKTIEPNANVAFPVRLTVVESGTPNAFATMGGYAYVTTGLIEMADREEEVAGVLSHEFGHLGRRHVAKRMEQEKPLTWATLAGMLLGTLGAMIPGAGALGPALMTSTMAAAQTVALKFSREDEDEADRFGLATAEASGYSGHGLADFLKKIRSTESERMIPQYLLTHPYSDVRAAKIESRITLPKTTVNTDFFPYVQARLKILNKTLGPAIEDTWMGKHEKDPKDPVSAYGAALVYTLLGNTVKAEEMIRNMDSPYKNLFLGEILVRTQRFKEAAEVLRTQTDPIASYFLASALEGSGDLSGAADVLKGLFPYKESLPIIYQRFGMVAGRLGYEGLGYEYLGRYYLEIGRPQVARTYLEKASAKYGRNTDEAREVQVLLDETKPEKPGEKDGKTKQQPQDKGNKQLRLY